MKKLFTLPLLLLLALTQGARAQLLSNIPIGKMPIAPVLKQSAYVPIIQPYDGRTTNDNFRVSVTNWLGFTTNSPVQNFYVTNLYVTNLFVSNIVNGGELWMTNAGGAYLPTITNTATIVVGQSAEAWWVPSGNDGFVSVHDASAGDANFNSLAIAAIDTLLQEDFSQFVVTVASGAETSTLLSLKAATNYQNLAAPVSHFNVSLDPRNGQVLVELENNNAIPFAVSNDVTSVQAIQLVPRTNAPLALAANQINVASNSYVALEGSTTDPNDTTIELSAGVRDGMLLLLQNIGAASAVTLFNGSPLYDDPTHYVTLGGGNWATTNAGDGLLLVGGLSGWSEVGRFNQNTNVTSELWELVGPLLRPAVAQSALTATNISGIDTLNALGAFRYSLLSDVALAPGTTTNNPYNISFIKFTSTTTNATDTTLRLSGGNGSGQHLLLGHGDANSFQLINGDTLTDDAAKHVFLSGGDWKPERLGEMLLLFQDTDGWHEVGRNRAGSDTNIVTDQLWELVSGHMRTTPDAPDDWQFRYNGTAELTIRNDGAIIAEPEFHMLPITDASNEAGMKVWPVLDNNGFEAASIIAFGDGVHTNHSTTYGIYGESAVATYSTDSEAFGVWGDANAPHVTLGVGTLGNARQGTNRVGIAGAVAGGSSLGISVLGAMGSSPNSTNVVFYADTARYYTTRPAQNAMFAANNRATGYPLFVGMSNGIPAFTVGGSGVTTIYGFNAGNNSDYARVAFSHTGTNGATVFDSQSAGTAGAGRPYAFQVDGTNAVLLGLKNGGSGTTQPYLTFTNSSGQTGTIEINSGGIPLLSSSSGSWWGPAFRAGPGQFMPEASDTTKLGAIGNSAGVWAEVVGRKLYSSGFLNGTNYSRLLIEHQGTNGTIVFDSQSLGTAGAPRPMDFDFGGTNKLRLSVTGNGVQLEDTTTHTIAIEEGTSGTVQFINTGGTGTPVTTVGNGLVLVQRNSVGDLIPAGNYGVLVNNPFVATAGQQQNSPGVSWAGTGYGTNSTTSQTVEFASYVVPTSGADTPTGVLRFSTVISNTTPVTQFELDSQGPITLVHGVTAAEKAVIAPKEGMLVRQTDSTPGIYAYVGGAWGLLGGGGGGNVVNSGASVAGMIPTYTDTSGTAVTPTNAVPSLDIAALTLSGPIFTPIFTTATNYTASTSDQTVLANGTTLTITLPTAVGVAGKEYTVKLLASSTATVGTTSSQNIDGATTYSLSAQYKFVRVQSDGTQWWITGAN